MTQIPIEELISELIKQKQKGQNTVLFNGTIMAGSSVLYTNEKQF